MGEELPSTIKDYEPENEGSEATNFIRYLLELKKTGKWILNYHKKQLYYSLGFLIFSLSNLGVAYGLLNYGVKQNSPPIVILGIIPLYFFTFTLPLPIVFLERYIANYIKTSLLFYQNTRAIAQIDKMLAFQDMNYRYIGDIRGFQIILTNFKKNYFIEVNRYLTDYKGRIRAYKLMLEDSWFCFRMSILLASINVERDSKIKLLQDFKDYMQDTKKSILIPLIRFNLLLDDFTSFYKKWDGSFKNNHQTEYVEATEILENQIKSIKTRKIYQQEVLKKTVELVTGVLTLIVTILAITLPLLSKI